MSKRATSLTTAVRSPRHRLLSNGGFRRRRPGGPLAAAERGFIPVTNTSVNPARSTGPAIFVGGWALQQLWLFWVAPILGAVIGGWLYRTVFEVEREPVISGRAVA